MLDLGFLFKDLVTHLKAEDDGVVGQGEDKHLFYQFPPQKVTTARSGAGGWEYVWSPTLAPSNQATFYCLAHAEGGS